MSGELNSFFEPKSIAVIGASITEGKVGNILIKKLKKFKGSLIPVNPNREKIENLKCYKKVTDYPRKIDLAIIATPKKIIKKILKDIEKKEIKNLIIISSGFSEEGYKKDEETIKKWAEKNKINLLGPNSFGIMNPEKKIDATFSKANTTEGDTVFISQSGALASYVADLEIPLRAYISVGNAAGLNFSDWIEYFNNDKKTKKIVLYIEKLKDGKRFIEACKNSKKKIYVVKAGKTDKGQKSTMSHTGSLSTEIDIYKGAFKQAGVKYRESLAECFGLEKDNPEEALKGKKIAIITNSGGAGALLTDSLVENEYKIFGPKDILGTAKPIDYKRALHRITKEYDNIIVILTPQSMSDPINTAKTIAESRWKKRIIALFLGKKSMTEAVEILKGHGIPVYTKSI